VYVHGLRQALGPDRIETHGSGYRFRVEPGELDLERFEQLAERGRRALAAGRANDAADDLGRALALWTGPALADLADEPLAASEAGRLEELRLAAVETRNDAELELGRHDALAANLEPLVAEQPFRERFREQLVLALYRAGRQADALEAYRAARSALVEELGVEPGPALQELERMILRHDPALAPRAPEARVEQRLPSPPTPLVGRRLEIAAVTALLRREDVRLVTLTGPGGTGKTRLALAVAEEIAPDLRDGAVFVDLAAVRDPALLAPTIASALGVQEGERTLAEAIADDLRERSLLLLLDNFEQLLPAAPLVSELLAEAPRLAVLATSRAPLRLRGEHEYPAPPLQLPLPVGEASFEQLAENDAVRLFIARGRAVDPDFRVDNESVPAIAEICRRLDGLPLAIELAAARSKLLPPVTMARRLGQALELLTGGARDLPERQQTLRATLDWSHDLLSTEERSVFARLAVFAGGCTIEAAEAVCGVEAVAPLGSLVDESLLRRIEWRSEPRFVMLETVREYAVERLAESGETEATRSRHASWFVDLAESSEAAMLSGDDPERSYYRRLDAEYDNLRAALAWTAATGELEVEVRLACALRQYWVVRGELTEGWRVFEGLIARTEGGDPGLHARVLGVGALFPWRQGRNELAKKLWEEALPLYRELGDEDGIGRCVAELGSVAIGEGDLDRAAALYEEAVTLFRAQGNLVRLGIVLGNLGAVAGMRDDNEAAARYQEEAVATQRQTGDRDALAVSLHNLARPVLALGRVGEARTALGESLRLALTLGYREVIAYCLEGAAELALAGGELESAARLIGASEGVFEAIGVPVMGVEDTEYRSTIEGLIEGLGEGAFEELRAAGRAADPDEIEQEALSATLADQAGEGSSAA
jgi:predicted ATPase